MAKVDCGECKRCSPSKKDKTKKASFKDLGKNRHDPDLTDLQDEKTGERRACPSWAVKKGTKITSDEIEAEERAKAAAETEEEEEDFSWVVDEGYGPKCRECGAGRSEEHCRGCPYFGHEFPTF